MWPITLEPGQGRADMAIPGRRRLCSLPSRCESSGLGFHGLLQAQNLWSRMGQEEGKEELCVGYGGQLPRFPSPPLPVQILAPSLPSTLLPQPILTLDSSHLAVFHCCSLLMFYPPPPQALQYQPCHSLLPWDLAHAPERCQ